MAGADQIVDLVVAFVEHPGGVEPPEDVPPGVGARHAYVLADGERHRTAAAVDLLGELHAGGRTADHEDAAGGQLRRRAVGQRGDLVDRGRQPCGERRHRGDVGHARGEHHAGAAPCAAVGGDGVPVTIDRHPDDPRPGLHRRADRPGVVVDQLDDLGHRHEPVGITPIGEAGQAGVPARREQPQRVPPLGPPRVGHPAALQHDVVDRALGQALAHRQAGVAGTDDDRADGFAAHRSAQCVSTTTVVGLVMMSNTAERFCDWATERGDLVGGGVGVDVEADGDAAEAVARLRVGPEDAEDVHRALDGRGDRAQLDATVLGHGGDAGGQAAAQRRQDDLHRGGALVQRGEALRMVGVERERGLVDVLLAQAGEPGHGRAAVRAAHPLGRRTPGELGGLGHADECVAGGGEGRAVDTVVDGLVGSLRGA